MTVGFHGPLPPARSGVADYCAVLLGELRRHGPVASLGNSGAPERSGVALYHLGNNGLHAAIYRRALERPGVIVLHDAVLHHFLLGQLDEEEYVDEFAYNYGAWHRPLARELWRARATSGSDPRYFEYPMLKRVVERSLAVVVHNPAARALVLRHVPAARVAEIPHLFSPPELPALADALRWRQTLGYRPRVPVTASLATCANRSASCRCSASSPACIANFPRRLCWWPANSLPATWNAPPARCSPRPASCGGRIWRSASSGWRRAPSMPASTSAIPAAGETSGISIRLMGLGKPVLVTEGAENARFPEDACIRIPAGLAEPDSLTTT